ncbi:MAG: C40 family peptidase [Bacteroidia bacterium]|nr:C40 family peptidase [Bacteroidia bacterium]
MQKGICTLSVIPLRSEPTSKAELCSQLLFGETYEVLEETEEWTKIKTELDEYEGWISQNQYVPWDGINESRMVLEAFPHVKVKNLLNDESFFILPGSLIHQKVEVNNVIYFKVNNVPYEIDMSDFGFLGFQKTSLLEWINYFKNSPYLWGGRTFLGIDCSGYTQLVYKLMGIQLPRDAYQQAEMGEIVDFVNESRLGDLAFFANESGKITHVGIIIGSGEIMHASGKVRKDIIDSYGIFNEKEGKHTHKLSFIKRLL